MTESGLQFNFVLEGSLFEKTVDIDFGGSLPGIGLEVDAGINVKMGYVLGMGIGFQMPPKDASGKRNWKDALYLDTEGPGRNGAELELYLDATLAKGSNITGNLAILEASLTEIDDYSSDSNNYVEGEVPSGVFGSFFVDIKDTGTSEQDDRLTIQEISSATSFKDYINMGVVAEVDVDLIASLSAGPIALGSNIHVDASVGWDMETGFTVVHPIVEFEDVSLDLSAFFGDVLGPILIKINKYLEPIRQIFEVLDNEIPGLGELGFGDEDGDGRVTIYEVVLLVMRLNPATSKYVPASNENASFSH